MREIKIQPVLNGWVVWVGCGMVVFDELDIMLGQIRCYIKDPKTVEQQYIDKCPNPILKDAILNQGDAGFDQTVREVIGQRPNTSELRAFFSNESGEEEGDAAKT